MPSHALRYGLITIIFGCGVLLIGWQTPSKTHHTTPYAFPDLSLFPTMPVAANNPVTVEGVALGRLLFYDPILSLDSTISCSSCHQQAYAFSDGPLQFSKGISGEPLTRNTMPLYNLAWYKGYFWDGRAATIEDQVFFPVRHAKEMGLNWKIAEQRLNRHNIYRPLFYKAFATATIDSVLIAKAIAQFERTLISNQSKYDRALRMEVILSKDEYAGFELINDQSMGNCLHCHVTDASPLGTNGGFANNGLDRANLPSDYPDSGLGGITGKAREVGQFKVPSLRNITVTAPYMHDGRFSTLEEVLQFYNNDVHATLNLDPVLKHQSKQGLQFTAVEIQQIIAFLETLTDSIFLTDPKFSNPFPLPSALDGEK